MQINLSWDSSVSGAPAGFQAAVQQAATLLGQSILNPITVSIQVGWGEDAGSPMTSGALGGFSQSVMADYYLGQIQQNNSQITASLSGQLAKNDIALATSSNLPSGTLVLSTAQAQILGIPYTASSSYDGAIGFATSFPSSVFLAGAIHELTHALGRVNGWVSGGTWLTTLDMYTYSAPGQLWAPNATVPGYFSLDGGVTNLGNFSLADAGDFSSSTGSGDPFSEMTDSSATSLTLLDKQILQALGFAVATNAITLAPNTMTHTAASTTFTGDGGDTVAFSGSESQYHINTTLTPGTITVQDTVAMRDGAAAFSNVARLQFTDQSIAFDLGTGQSTGQAAELLGAAFGPQAVTDKALMGDWIRFFDNGGNMQQAAHDLVASGNVSAADNASFVKTIWQNVVGTPIDSGNLTTFTNDLANGVFTQASLLDLAAGVTQNQTRINLTGLSQNGLSFSPVTTIGDVSAVTYSNPSYDYSVTNNQNVGTITVSGSGVTDTLVGINRVKFSDAGVAFDLGPTQNAGETALLVNAADGSYGLSNRVLVGHILALADQGASSLSVLAQAAMTSGALSFANNASFVQTVWQNVMGAPIDAADLATFTGYLNSGTYTETQLLSIAAGTSPNQSQVNLVGIAQHGLAYTPA